MGKNEIMVILYAFMEFLIYGLFTGVLLLMDFLSAMVNKFFSP